jgi:branched-subunit amino acid aminotransferase/4-amino-4-deoxychorismate lyase
MGFFETVLVRERAAVLFHQHWNRLSSTLSRLEFPAPSREAFFRRAKEAIDEAGILADDTAEQALRLAWIAVGTDLELPESWRLDASLRAIPAWTLERRAGVRALTLPSWLQRDTPGVKSTSYFAAVVGQRLARKAGANEGLFVDSANHYLEGTSTGLARWEEGAGKFFQASGSALASVTLSALCGENTERIPLSSEDLRRGCVLAGSLTKAVPLLSLDGEPCTAPPRMLQEIEAFNQRLVSDPLLVTVF